MILKKIKIDYDFDIFLNSDFFNHEGSCIIHQKKEQDDIYKSLEKGFPDSYNEHNTKIHQVWFKKEDLDYKKLESQLSIEIVTISAILQTPGNTITLHKDTFYQIKKKYPNDQRTLVRANIYLKDWEVGHIIQYQDIEGQWHNHTHWKQGEGLLWDNNVQHLGANVGIANKYTLQISGFLK